MIEYWTLFDEIQLDHSHGTMNKMAIITVKQNRIESINMKNLKCDILWIFIINSSVFVLLLFINTDFGRFVGVVTNWIDSVKLNFTSQKIKFVLVSYRILQKMHVLLEIKIFVSYLHQNIQDYAVPMVFDYYFPRSRLSYLIYTRFVLILL